MIPIFVVLIGLCLGLSEGFHPSRTYLEKKMALRIEANQTDTIVTTDSGVKRPPKVTTEDISNPNKGRIIRNPVAFNIYYGSTWTTKKMNIIDNFAANIGTTEYWQTMNSQVDGKTGQAVAALVYKGSVWDNTVTATLLSVDPDGMINAFSSDSTNYVTTVMQNYVTAKKIKATNDFDLNNFDLDNTIFSLMFAPGFDFPTSPSYCGFHGQISVIYPGGAVKKIFVAVDLHGQANTQISSCSYFGSAGYDGVKVRGQGWGQGQGQGWD
jgi:hypothetical protein